MSRRRKSKVAKKPVSIICDYKYVIATFFILLCLPYEYFIVFIFLVSLKMSNFAEKVIICIGAFN